MFNWPIFFCKSFNKTFKENFKNVLFDQFIRQCILRKKINYIQAFTFKSQTLNQRVKQYKMFNSLIQRFKGNKKFILFYKLIHV